MTGKRAAGEKCGVRADLPERGILVLYLGLFAATALLLVWFQPLQPTSPMLVNPPDEFTRIVIPRYICDHGTLPTGFEPEVQIAGYGGSYAFFPYLPYIFMGWAMRLTSLFTGQEAALTMAARCVNVASGLLMAVTVYFLSRRVFQDRAVRWAFCYIVMFWPEQLFVHTYVNTESMSLLSTAMILLALVAVYQEGPEIRHSVLLAAGLVLCLLTYYNAYGYVLAAVVLFVGSFLYPVRHPLQHPGEKCQSMFSPVSGQGREQSQNTFENGISVPSSDAGGAAGKGLVCDRSLLLRRGFLVLALVLAGAGWWFVRSAVLFHGDLFGLATMRKVREPLQGIFPPTYRAQGKSIPEMFRETGLFSQMLKSFIASYGANSIFAGPGLYFYDRCFLFGGAALAVVFGAAGERRRSGRRRFFHAVVIAAALSVLALWLWYSYAMDFQPQGRYLLASILPLFYYMTAGWMHLADALRIRGRLRTALAAMAAAAAVFWELRFVLGTVLPLCVSIYVA